MRRCFIAAVVDVSAGDCVCIPPDELCTQCPGALGLPHDACDECCGKTHNLYRLYLICCINYCSKMVVNTYS